VAIDHHHDRPLPGDSDSNTDSVGQSDGNPKCNAHTGYPDSNSDSYSGDTNPDTNGHTGYPKSDGNSHGNTRPDLHVDLRQPGADHHRGRPAGDALPIEHHGGGCE
jgi:hypothetical protein